MSRIAGIALVLLAVNALTAHADTLSVCASGCTYSNPQSAIDAARYGDTVLLRAGETFTAHLVLPAKPGSGWIDIRSDADDSQLPDAATRLVPDGRPGSNTPRARLARLIGRGGAYKTSPLLRAAPGAHGYRIRFLDFDGVAHLGYETLVQLGDDGATAPPYDIVLDRVYIHGHKSKGQKRGIALHGVRLSVVNSYISDIMAVNADSQGIVGYNGGGPLHIENNFLEAAGENILFGGGDPATAGLVPSDITIRRNHLYKPLAWRDDILAPPSGPRAGSAVSGSLASGSHYFKIVALMDTGTRTAVSAPSTEVAASVSASRGVPLTWSAVTGADRYRIYRGTSAGGQNRYVDTSSSATSFTYTGASEASGSPASRGTRWVVKNTLELKNAERVLIDGNLLDYIWESGQFGYAFVLTPRNAGQAPWTRVRDVTITNNIVKGASGVINISGYDDSGTTLRTERVLVRNNLFHDIDNGKYGGLAKVFLIGGGPSEVVIDSNTIVHTNSSVLYPYGSTTMPSFVYKNNISLHNKYGIMGESSSPGLPTIATFFPGGVVACNVLAGGKASLYPSSNATPPVSDWYASFENFAAGDYRLKAGSVVASAGCGGTVPGVGFAALAAAQGATPPPVEPDPDPVEPGNKPPVARPGGPYTAQPGVSVTVSGTGSSDPDGAIAGYRWTWGDEVLVRAADVPAAAIVGKEWVRETSSAAAGGAALRNPNLGEPKRSAPRASPASYVDLQVSVAAGVPYRLWMRLHAAGNAYANDSLYVQFSGALTSDGRPVARIGTTEALSVILEDGRDAGVSGWGWNDDHYGGSGTPIFFAASGVQTIRLQAREDGVAWDQLVLSSDAWFDLAPGLVRNDGVILPSTTGTSSGPTPSHSYQRPGVYPLQLTVVDTAGASATAGTTVTVGGDVPPGSGTATRAEPGGPYAAKAGAVVTVDGSASAATSGAIAGYTWTWGDEVLVRAADLAASAVHGQEWVREASAAAAGGTALRNPNRGAAKRRDPLASPASYVEFQVHVASGVPYRLWMRMHASGDAYANDSLFVQFSGAVTEGGVPVARIGTTAGVAVILEEGVHAGVSGWGWSDDGYGEDGMPLYFENAGVQTIRIQAREDGVAWDQLVLTSDAFIGVPPGAVRQDTTHLPTSFGQADGAVASHLYRRTGTYPVRLTVIDNNGDIDTAATVVTVGPG